jgi:hypothetical protein
MPQTAEPDPWLEAARHYSQLDGPGRYAYWSQLGSEQQVALTAALNHIAVPTPATSVASPRRGGIFSVAAFGCLGFALGSVFAVAAQVVLVVAGLRSLMPELPSQSPQPTSSWTESSSDDDELEYLNSTCTGPPKSHEEELFCRVWLQEHPEP